MPQRRWSGAAAPALLAILPLLVLVAAHPASADPRWWWDDMRLTETPTDSVMPHVVVPGYALGSGATAGKAVFVTWAEVDPAEGDLEIWMRATFTGGCSWCAPMRLTDNAVDDTHPRIAVLLLPAGTFSFAVAFESAGRVVVAWDSATARYGVPADELCAQIEPVGPAIIANGQYVTFGAGAADHPRLCQGSTPLFGHFHLAWHETGPAGRGEIRYAHDLIGLGGDDWLRDAPLVLPPADPLDDVAEPSIACDVGSDPDPVTGRATGDRSSPSVAFVEIDPAGSTSIVGLRSVDSGMTFSPSGRPPAAPAARISDGPAGGVRAFRRPAIDAGSNFIRTDAPAWLMTVYQDEGRAPDVIRCDARRVEDAVVPAPDWQAADRDLSQVAAAGDGGPSVSVLPAGPAAAEAWVAWQDSRFGAREIACRGAWLDQAAADPVDLGRFPYAPARPADVAVAGDMQLSHCVFDEATSGCGPTRVAGEAGDVEIDSNEIATWAAWSDTRDGNHEIYVKRTDRRVARVVPELLAGCGVSGDAWIDVRFDPLTACPDAQERMVRYSVYYGTDPGGPFLDAATPIVVMHDAATTPTTVRLAGLAPGTTYAVVVVPEDQARNVSPPGFDPQADGPAALADERSIVTPQPCVPQICLWRSDVVQLLPHAPSRAAVYLVPPSPDDIALQGAEYRCPFATGDVEPDANALDNRVPLVLYQVNRPLDTLRLAKSGTTIVFAF
jgi:hypothetical protein